MMKLLSVETNEAGRKALVEVYFEGEHTGIVHERFWLVGEMPFYGDDSSSRLEFALMGTVRFSNSADAIKFYANYKCQETALRGA